MRTTIDKAGRIVVPKHMRDELGFDGGSEVEIEIVDDHIRIAPVPTSVRLVRRDGVLVAVPDRDLPPLTEGIVRSTLERVRR